MTVYKKENGKWYCHFKIKGKQKHLLCHGATSRAEAQAIEDAEKYLFRQQLAGLISSKKTKTYTAEYLFNNLLTYSKDKEKKSYSKDKYQSAELLRYFKSKNLANDISQINQKDIFDLQIYLKNTPTSRGNKRANSTVNKYIACLKTAFNLLVKDERININSNPCIGVKSLTEDNRREVYLPKDKKEEFLSLLPEMVRDIVELDLTTGLRIGNVLNAEKHEFNLIDGYWTIKKMKNKGKKDIKIKLNKTALRIVKMYINSCEDFLFINPMTQKPIQGFRKSFKSAAEKIGIADLQPKDLRRTVGTWLYQDGVSLRVIKDVLHHSNTSTTERYLGITPKELDNAYDKLDNYNDN